jgi:hypothetical protein
MDKETKLTMALLIEKLEKTTGKKVKFGALKEKKGCGCGCDGKEKLTEGTWNLPKGNDLILAANQMIAELQAFQNKWSSIIGDDELYNGIDSAEFRLKAIIGSSKQVERPARTARTQEEGIEY